VTFFPSVSDLKDNPQQTGWTGWYPVSANFYAWYADAPNPKDPEGGGWIVLPSVPNANSFKLLFDLPNSAQDEGWLVKVQVDSGAVQEVKSSGDTVVVDGGKKGEPHSLRVQATCINTRGGCGSPSDPFRLRGVDVEVVMATVSNRYA
jgi:hypothetical protein